MPNVFTNTDNTIMLQSALEAFSAALTPLRAFSLNASPEPMDRGEKVKVLSIPNQAAAISFTGTYTTQDLAADGIDVTLNKHEYVSWGLTDKEVANQPLIELERFGQRKGFQLAKKVWQDILSIVTAANYGAPAHTGLAANFDSDDVIDISGVCDAADWPEMGRSLVLSSAYHTNLRKDSAIKDASAFGSDSSIRRGMVISLDTFEAIYKSNLIPGNAENLVGFACIPDGMLVAMRYLQPQPGNKYSLADTLTDPQTGITMGYREWYSEDTGMRKAVIECLYGYAPGNTTALKRIISAAP